MGEGDEVSERFCVNCKCCAHYFSDSDNESGCSAPDDGAKAIDFEWGGTRSPAPYKSAQYYRSRWWMCGEQARWFRANYR